MPQRQCTVVDLTVAWPPTSDYLPAHAPTTWAVTGRAKYGWVLSLAVGSDADLFFEIVPGKGQYASYRHATLTITSPSGQAAQFATISMARGLRPSVTAILDGMGMGGPLAAALDPAAPVGDVAAGWAAAQVLFAALHDPKVLTSRPDLGPLDQSEHLAWAAAGFTRRARAVWEKWIDAPAVASQYRAAGFTPETAVRWVGAYQSVPADLAIAFQVHGWTSGDLNALTFHLGGPTPGVLAQWLAVPAEGRLAVAAMKAGLSPEEAAAVARDRGLDGDILAVMRSLRPSLVLEPIASPAA